MKKSLLLLFSESFHPKSVFGKDWFLTHSFSDVLLLFLRFLQLVRSFLPGASIMPWKYEPTTFSPFLRLTPSSSSFAFFWMINKWWERPWEFSHGCWRKKKNCARYPTGPNQKGRVDFMQDYPRFIYFYLLPRRSHRWNLGLCEMQFWFWANSSSISSLPTPIKVPWFL